MHFFYLVWELTKTDFKLRYSGSVLGYVWVLLKPLLMFSILNFVFSNIFGQQQAHYSLNLLVGIVLWAYFTEGTLAGMNSILAKASLISKVATAPSTVIIASTLHTTITFVINLGFVAIFFGYYHITPTVIGLLYAALFSVLTYLLILSASLALAPLFVRYRDINQIWEVLLTLGFYAAPIIYPLTIIPPHLQKFLWLNPMSYLINYAKLALINNYFIPPSRLLVLLAVVAICLTGGGLVYFNLRRTLAEYL